MKQNVLALALAVLPATVSAAAENHCYFKFTCLKAKTLTGTSTIQKCDGTNAGDYLTATTAHAEGVRLFDDKGGMQADGTTSAAHASACLEKMATAEAASADGSAAVLPSALLGEFYSDSACEVKLCSATAADNKCLGTDAALTKRGSVGANAAIPSDGSAFFTTEETTHAAFSDIVLLDRNLSGTVNVGTNKYNAVDDVLTNEVLKNIGIGDGDLPPISKKTIAAAGVIADTTADTHTDDTDTTGCTAFDADLKSRIDRAPASSAAGSEAFYTLTTNAKAAGKSFTDNINASATALTAAPTGVSARCGAGGAVEFTYHKAKTGDATKICEGAHDGAWSPANSTTGKLTCIAVTNALHPRCTGVSSCAGVAKSVLAAIAADTVLRTAYVADVTKAAPKCLTGDLSDATAVNKNSQCTKSCQCLDTTNSKYLNWAWSTQKAADNKCWLSSTQPGVLAVDGWTETADWPTEAVTAGKLNSSGRVAQAAAAAINMAVFTTVDSSTCGAKEIAQAATPLAAGAADFTSTEYDTVYTKKGCGFTAPAGDGGATTALASAAATSVFAALAAALL